jgi:MarR family 2-MHQ and catechol resistance regulon transcriptional repressor
MINNNPKINVDIIAKLLVTARALETAGDEIFSQFGITLGSYEILVLIDGKVDTTTRMANQSQITLASITHKTKIMEEKGYIRRVMDRQDKRIWYFSLTPRGQSLLETVREVYAEVTRPLFAQFSESEKQQVLTVLSATEKHLRDVTQNRLVIRGYVNKLIQQKGMDAK